MTTSISVMTHHSPLPLGTEEVRSEGLLSSVERPCPDHGRDCRCVGRQVEAGGLVYWCATGAHHFSAR